MTGLRRLAARAPAPVFVARGEGAGLAPIELAAHAGVNLVGSPRRATLVLAAGRFPVALGAALDRVHDQLPHPRGAVWWRPAGHDAAAPAALAGAPVCEGIGAAGRAIRAVHRHVVADGATRADVLPDRPPHPFAGRGDHGQGGEGMMGGVPYGRAMAATAGDRDGLALDQLRFVAGPFLVGLPTALAIEAALQGGVVQRAELLRLAGGGGPAVDPVARVFARAMTDPVALGRIERARARHLLRWSAEVCRLAGLPALARRAAALAAGVDRAGPGGVDRFGRALWRSGLLAWWSGIGRFDAGSPALTGPNARAAGVAADARADDPAYLRLGFRPLTGRGTDSRARLEQRLAEVHQALALAQRAEDAGVEHDPGAPVEPPTGPVAEGTLASLAGALVGMDWSDALVTVCSLDLAEPDRPAGRAGAPGPAGPVHAGTAAPEGGEPG